jgi:outer membrane protein OmpA-like peptidoglycan-associated protein
MKPLFLCLFMPLALMGCAQNAIKNEAPGAASQSTGLAVQQQRITEERVLADRKTIDSLQQRLRKLSETGIAQTNYPLAKAQCWLDTAKTQYHENDRTGYIEESLTESQKIIQALEADKNTRAGFETPLVARSTRLRDDLWMELGKFKNNAATLSCNARTVACAEVRLVRAGHAEEQTGWRAATPHVMMVEDGLRRAGVEAASCVQPVVASAAPAAVAATAAPAPAPAPIVREVTKETFVILADTLFQFDKSGRDQMLPGGKERLAAVANRLKSYQSIATLSIAGHTDRLGSDTYNDPLSARRAATVLEYLGSLGVKAAKSDAVGKGEREPVTTQCSAKAPRAQQIICLQPDRRVTIEVTGVVK